MKRNPAHLIDELLVYKILSYRPRHPTAIILQTVYSELQNCLLYINDPEGFIGDKELTLEDGDLIRWYIPTMKMSNEILCMRNDINKISA